MATIWQDLHQLAQHLSGYRRFQRGYVVATSGGFDCLHVGHLRCILSSRRYGECLVVIVNGDGFLERKKGYVFMPLAERLEIVAAIGGVDHVVGWDDGSQFVAGALQLLKPDVFTKGGDRSSPSDIAPTELAACKEIGCRIEYGVGGRDKVQSSSSLVGKIPK
jgi:D-beta-D-heptose 7-phosphate kinase/D-beta-D-heptose 1-phosphate adenosyltransferase